MHECGFLWLFGAEALMAVFDIYKNDTWELCICQTTYLCNASNSAAGLMKTCSTKRRDKYVHNVTLHKQATPQLRKLFQKSS
jgi:hypothetical protein